jgi:hypothetical protein
MTKFSCRSSVTKADIAFKWQRTLAILSLTRGKTGNQIPQLFLHSLSRGPGWEGTGTHTQVQKYSIRRPASNPSRGFNHGEYQFSLNHPGTNQGKVEPRWVSMPFLVPVSKPRQAFHGEYSSSLDHPGPDHGITSTASIHPLSPHGDQYHGKEYHGRK